MGVESKTAGMSRFNHHIFDIPWVNIWNTFGIGDYPSCNEVFATWRKESKVVEDLEAISKEVLEKEGLGSDGSR